MFSLKPSRPLSKDNSDRVTIIDIVKLLVIFCIFPSCLFSQKIVEGNFVSKFTQDTVKYKVYVPRKWTSNGRYPSIYINQYGALAENGMLVAAEINNWVNRFPETVVIEIISGDMKNIDFNYESEDVGERGRNFIKSLKDELIPTIEKNFKTTRFRGLMGQSYSASYLNYLFVNEPGIFNAYVSFSPEKIEGGKSKFTVSPALQHYYNQNPTMFYIAAAGGDLDRRKNYALDMKKTVSILDSVNFRFKYELFDQADHNSIVSFATLPSLKFIFGIYNKDNGVSRNIVETFNEKQARVQSFYGLDIPRTSSMQSSYLDAASESKNTDAMVFFAEYFQDKSKEENALMLFNTGYVFYNSFKDYDRAEKYLRLSIKSALEFKTRVYILNGYGWLSRMFYDGKNDVKKAQEILQEGFIATGSSVFKYKIGALSVESGKGLDLGIDCLEYFLSHPVTTYPETERYTKAGAYLLLAKCYHKKKQIIKAREFLEKSLNLDSSYEAAIKFRSEINM